MGDQDNSEGRTGRRAMILGAAAVGAGAVAGVATQAGTALASSDAPEQATGFVPLSRKIVVRLPAVPFNIDQSISILQRVLGAAGHSGCFSGLDFEFTYENEVIVNAKGQVEAEI